MKNLIAYLVIFLFWSTSFNSIYAQSCATPSGLIANSITAESAQLVWDDQEAVLYRIRYRVPGGNWTFLRTRSNSVTISALEAGTDYEFQVRARCTNRRSSWSTSVFFTTDVNNDCSTPEGLFTLGIGSIQATLTWQVVSGALNYDVQIRAVGTDSWTPINGITSNLTIADGLTANTSYEYQVRANCTGSSSAFSQSETFTTQNIVCELPDNFQLNAITINTADITWDAVDDADHYLVRYRELGTTDWLIRDLLSSTLVTLIDLFPNTTYEAQIQVDCILDTTGFTESITFTTDQIEECATPQNLSASQISETFATHNWDPVIGAIDYNIRRRVAGTQSWSFETTTAATSIQTFLLEPGTTYEFQVEANCLIGSSGFSNSTFYSTDESAPCPAPVNLVTSDITDSSVVLNWEDHIEVRTWTVQYRIQGTNNWTTETRNFSNLSLSNLASDTDYQWRVRSNCESIESDFSTIISFSTLPQGTCPTPTGLFVLGITNSSATLTWQTVSGALNYNIRYRELNTAIWINRTDVSSNLLGISGLDAGTTYEFQVQSVCNTGNSSFSSSDEFSTTGTALSQAPTGATTQPQVYPNPVRDHFTVSLTGQVGELIEIQLMDGQGNAAFTVEHVLKNPSETVTIPLSKGVPGLYYLLVHSTTNLSRTRLIVK